MIASRPAPRPRGAPRTFPCSPLFAFCPIVFLFFAFVLPSCFRNFCFPPPFPFTPAALCLLPLPFAAGTSRSAPPALAPTALFKRLHKVWTFIAAHLFPPLTTRAASGAPPPRATAIHSCLCAIAPSTICHPPPLTSTTRLPSSFFFRRLPSFPPFLALLYRFA